MNFSKEDQNTFLMVLTILVVSIISIIVILNLIWSFLITPIQATAENIAELFQAPEAISYNFQIPPTSVEPEVVPTSEDSTAEDVNSKKYELPFREARVLGYNGLDQNTPLLKEALEAAYRYGEIPTQIKLNVEIPSIDLSAPALIGSDAGNILQRGFYIFPGSDINGNGTLILSCYRSQFASSDARSCWHLDVLNLNDEINIQQDSFMTNYRIVERTIVDVSDESIYQKQEDGQYLKIITNYPEALPNKRLVILAEKVTSTINANI